MREFRQLGHAGGGATLEDYYRAIDRFVDAGSGFRPAIGDVALYSADSPFGQHTNIVVAVDGNVMTTIGRQRSRRNS